MGVFLCSMDWIPLSGKKENGWGKILSKSTGKSAERNLSMRKKSFTFQHDNDFVWPSHSVDLNPIENL